MAQCSGRDQNVPKVKKEKWSILIPFRTLCVGYFNAIYILGEFADFVTNEMTIFKDKKLAKNTQSNWNIFVMKRHFCLTASARLDASEES